MSTTRKSLAEIGLLAAVVLAGTIFGIANCATSNTDETFPNTGGSAPTTSTHSTTSTTHSTTSSTSSTSSSTTTHSTTTTTTTTHSTTTSSTGRAGCLASSECNQQAGECCVDPTCALGGSCLVASHADCIEQACGN